MVGMARKKDRLARMERSEKRILRELKRIEKDEHSIAKEEGAIKRYLASSHNIHATQFARAFVGSILGIVLSSFLFGSEIVNSIGMNSAIIMFLFTITAAAYVSYKTENGILGEQTKFSVKHTLADVLIYVIVGFIVTGILLFAFGVLPPVSLDLLRILLIYSLPAVAGALTLTLI
jgi:hypothetical protein